MKMIEKKNGISIKIDNDEGSMKIILKLLLELFIWTYVIIHLQIHGSSPEIILKHVRFLLIYSLKIS